jgi:ABC-2 type transport system permease protein
VTGLVRSELLKLRTTRTAWWLGGAAFVLLLLALVLPLAIQSSFNEHDVRSVFSSGGVIGLMMLVLGVVSSAGEYRHGTIASTLLVTPDRLRVSVTQALACGITGLAAGLAGVAITAVIALPWLAAKDAATLGAGEALGVLGSVVLYAGLAGALGAGVGALLRNQVAAVVLLLVVLFVIDPAVSAVLDPYAKFSLNGLTSALTGGSDSGDVNLLPVWAAALVWAGYTTLLVGGAAVLTSRRDI